MRIPFAFLAIATVCLAADMPGPVTLRGKLIVRDGKPAAVGTSDGKTIELDGDEPTRKVLADGRLNGFEIQAKGKFSASGRFTIDPMHTRSLLVHRDGGLKMITYWCDLCAIRAYTPGPCACCQRETTIDLRDPEHLEKP